MHRSRPFVIYLLLGGLLAGCANAVPATPSPAATPVPATVGPLGTAPAVFPTPTPIREAVSNGSNTLSGQVRLVWFYKPPNSGDLATIAKDYEFFILTRMDEGERDSLRALGVQAPILQYLLFDEVQDPGSCSESPNHNQVAENIGDFCELKQLHAEWFLRDARGATLSNDDGYRLMDPGNPDWRTYWLERARNSQENLGWQGVFLDNVEASLEKRRQSGALPAGYPDDASYQKAIEENLRYLYTTYFQPEGRPLFANIIALKDPAVWYRYLQYLDGAMIENFAVGWNDEYIDASKWEAQMDLVEQSQTLGKILLLVSQGGEFDHARETFSLASYLLVNHGNAYFRYTNAAAYEENWAYENTRVQFGTPLGERYQSGSLWVRDFERGRVWVDPGAHTAGIEVTP